MVSVVWFRKDLRLLDNIAVAKAVSQSQEILAVFHLNPVQINDQVTMSQSVFFTDVLHFKETLHKQGISLYLMTGDLQEAFEDLLTLLPNWTDIYFNYDDALFGRTRDQKAAAFFRDKGIRVHAFQDAYLHGTKEVLNQSGKPYQVFTPYFRRWIELPKPSMLKTVIDPNQWVTLETSKQVEQQIISLIGDLKGYSPGTEAALLRLKTFVEGGLKDYHVTRDFPAIDGTSKISPYLRSGQISIRQVYQSVSEAPNSQGKQTFIKELAWRDFYHMIAVNHPEQKQEPIQKAFCFVEWENNPFLFDKWKSGQTGFPFVDAAMRQLSKTGWMHNRLRMVVASFLTKDLLIDWRWGERYFQEALIDYDPASNIGGWQWAASTGTDAVPYFRIFNPSLQAKTYDPQAEFIKQYVPELANLPLKYIFEPQLLPKAVAEELQFELGRDYPEPIVNHNDRRKLAIARYELAKEQFAQHLENKD